MILPVSSGAWYCGEDGAPRTTIVDRKRKKLLESALFPSRVVPWMGAQGSLAPAGADVASSRPSLDIRYADNPRRGFYLLTY
jgi:hypothetical protein